MLRELSAAALVAGAAVSAYAVWMGQAEVGLLVIVPFLVGTGPLALLGIGLLFLGFIGISWWAMTRPFAAQQTGPPPPGAQHTRPAPKEAEPRTETRGGGVILLGPIPIVLGTDRRTALLAAVGGILLLLGLIAYFWLLPGP